MKRLIFTAVVCVFVASPVFGQVHGTVKYGGQVSPTRLNGYYDPVNSPQLGGGEFTMRDYTSGSLLLSNQGYAASTRGQDGNAESFQTFCVERDEYTADPMNIYVSLEFKDGTYPGSHAWEGGIGVTNGDDLDPRTAYLYTEFARGVLSNYDYGVPALRSVDAGNLQLAIWKIEGEITTALSGQALTWYNEAVSANWTDIGDVRVLQTTGSPVPKQDMLYLIPVPAAVLLGMLGLGVAGWRLRKFA